MVNVVYSLFQIVDGRPIKVSEVRKRAPPFDGGLSASGSGRSVGPPPSRHGHAGSSLPATGSAKDDSEGRYQPAAPGSYHERSRERSRAP